MGFDINPSSCDTPVARLMGDDLKMSSLLVDSGPLHKREVSLFLDLLEVVVNRWYTAIGKMNENIYGNYNSNIGLIHNLQDYFKFIIENDDESVFNYRKKLHRSLDDFSMLMDNFAEIFTGPPQLKEFYFNLHSRLLSTTEIMMEGKHGW